MYIILLINFITTALFAIEPSENATIITIFNTSDNSVKKCEVLFSLKKFIPKNGENTPLWISELLGNALNDKSPVVVADAVYQIGEFRFTKYNSSLIALFKNAEIKHRTSGYTERVQCAIITTLGKIGNSEAKTFLSELLRNDKGTYIGQFILGAIENLNDPVFINGVKQYKAKMEMYVANAKKQGCDPFLYSVKLAYIKFAEEIEKSLHKGRK